MARKKREDERELEKERVQETENSFTWCSSFRTLFNSYVSTVHSILLLTQDYNIDSQDRETKEKLNMRETERSSRFSVFFL